MECGVVEDVSSRVLELSKPFGGQKKQNGIYVRPVIAD
jgi:hypothetical protein